MISQKWFNNFETVISFNIFKWREMTSFTYRMGKYIWSHSKKMFKNWIQRACDHFLPILGMELNGMNKGLCFSLPE